MVAGKARQRPSESISIGQMRAIAVETLDISDFEPIDEPVEFHLLQIWPAPAAATSLSMSSDRFGARMGRALNSSD